MHVLCMRLAWYMHVCIRDLHSIRMFCACDLYNMCIFCACDSDFFFSCRVLKYCSTISRPSFHWFITLVHTIVAFSFVKSLSLLVCSFARPLVTFLCLCAVQCRHPFEPHFSPGQVPSGSYPATNERCKFKVQYPFTCALHHVWWSVWKMECPWQHGNHYQLHHTVCVAAVHYWQQGSTALKTCFLPKSDWEVGCLVCVLSLFLL